MSVKSEISAYEHIDLLMERYDKSGSFETMKKLVGANDWSTVSRMSFVDSWALAEQVTAITLGLA